MAERPDITPEMWRQLLRYDPETGKLYWRDRPNPSRGWRKRCAGKEAFTTVHHQGYCHSKIRGRTFLAHRVIWAIVHGEWPVEIDHINGERADNRLVNLRAVTHRENGKNMSRASNNTSGVTGVSWINRDQRWRAQIKIGGKTTCIGNFVDFEKAVAARRAAEAAHGYHPNHGRAPFVASATREGRQP